MCISVYRQKNASVTISGLAISGLTISSITLKKYVRSLLFLAQDKK